MKRIALHMIAMLGMVFSFSLQASTTWVPISVGDITTFVPYVPSEPFLAPENVQISFDGSVSVLVWDDIEHASQYEVQGLNADGEWVSIDITAENSITLDGRFDGFTSIQVVACGYNSCNSSGFSSAEIDFDIDEGAFWQAHRVFVGDEAVFSWRIAGGSNCFDELGNSVGPIGRIAMTTNIESVIQKTITCNGKPYSDTLAVLPNPSITLPTALANPIDESYSTVVGSIPDHFAVGSMGNATYTLPIATAPGSGGLVPDISLSYDSGSNNGLLGVGWSISGISILQKCAKTMVNDNEIGTVGDTDRLCLGGKRLVLLSGQNEDDYGAANAKYQLVDSTPMEIVAGSSLDTYNVTMLDGTVLTYSKFSTKVWTLSKKQDAAGNYIAFNYKGSGDLVQLSSIQYTGNEIAGISPNNEIVFNYEGRNDKIIRKGRNIYSRLESIESKVNGAELRKYTIQYKSAVVSGRSLIESIKSCAGSTCLKPTTFTWQEGSLDYADKKDIKIHSNKSKGQRALDGNGDGITDYWLIQDDNDLNDSSEHIRIVQGGSTPKLVQSNKSGANSNFRNSWEIIDFDHDGRDDVIYNSNGWRVIRSTVIDNNPDTINYDFDNPIPVNIPRSVIDIKIADFNGDGFADILYYDAGELYIQYFDIVSNDFLDADGNVSPDTFEGNDFTIPSGNYFTDRDQIENFFASNNPINNNIQAGDFDGDGINEIVFAIPTSFRSRCDLKVEDKKVYYGEWAVYTLGNNGFSYSKRLGGWNSENIQPCSSSYKMEPEVIARINIVDVDQDGSDEIVTEHLYPSHYHFSGSDPFVIKLKITSGISYFFDKEPIFESIVFDGTISDFSNREYHYLFSDYNSDGYLDFLFYKNSEYNTNNSKEVWKVAQFNGSTFDSDIFTNIEHLYNSGGINTFVELNGDGVPDYISFEGHLNYQISQSDKRDLLTSITNGFGQTTSIKYKSLSDEKAGGFYTRANNAVTLADPRCQPDGDYCAKILDIEIPINAVQQVSIEGQSRTVYQYKGLKAQHGVGLLGFSEVIAFEDKSDTRVTSKYHQVFPYTGKLYHSAVEHLIYSSELACEYDDRSGEDICRPAEYLGYVQLSSTDIAYAQYADTTCSTDGSQVCATYNEQFIYPETVTKQKYDVDNNSAILNTTTTTNSDLDEYGHIGTVTKVINDGTSDVATTVTTKVYEHESSVYGGRLTREKVVSSRPNENSVTQAITYTYNPNNNFLLESKEIDSVGNLGSTTDDHLSANFNSKEVYTRDSFGNVTLLEKTGASATSQTTKYVYDSRGRYITNQYQFLDYSASQTLAASISSSTTYDPILGLPLTMTSANGQVTTNGYNALGRLNYTFNPDGSYATVTQELCTRSGDCPTNGYYVETTTVSNGPNSKVYFDNKGLKLREKTQSLRNTQASVSWVQKNYGYDHLGRKIIESVPHFSGDLDEIGNALSYSAGSLPPLGYSFTVFDDFNRVTSLYKTDHGHWQTSYQGLTTTSTNPNQKSTVTVKNVLGEVVSVTDAQSNVVTYNYTALGKMRKVSRNGDNGTVITDIKFDHLGRKVQMTDPDVGIVKYRYDGFGNLLWQQDARNYRKCSNYDGVGRLKESYNVKGAICTISATLDAHIEYSYDGSVFGTGLVSYIYDHINDVGKQYYYNALSQVYREETTVDGKSYFQDTVYDSDYQYRVKKSYDASSGNGGIEYHYNDDYLVGKTDLVSGSKIWELFTTDAWGNAIEFDYGNGIKTIKTYNNYDGTLGSIFAGNGMIQDNSYHFTNVGNLEYRKDHISVFDEQFGYDSLNRLDDWTKTQGGASGFIDVNYDSLGNIKDKTGVGTYHYENSPHAVSRISDGSLKGNFTYDSNGNMTSGGGRSDITYNVNNKPLSITAGSHTTKFDYSIGGARIKRSDSKGGNTTDTLYMGNVEFVSENGKLLSMQRTIEGIAIETYFADTQKRKLEYLHFDHLGSAEVITTAEENPIDIVVQRFSFDPWGQRRSVDNYNTTYGLTVGLDLALSYYNKGFTGHEHLDESGLIHMNGRVYDPRLGRFLNADPAVQQEYNLQNLNRYSYVLNNPLNATDPSGYFWMQLVAAAVNYFTSASFAQSVAMSAVSYASNGSIQFSYSSADAFSYGQGAQRSTESQLFDSYNLGGNAYGLDQAKAQAHLSSDRVSSGVSGGLSKPGSEESNKAPTMTREEIRANKDLIKIELYMLKKGGSLMTNMPYETPDEAASKILKLIAPISAKYGLEIGGYIHQNEYNNLYTYSYPEVGNEGSMTGVLNRTDLDVYHTHPNGKLSFSTSTNIEKYGGDVVWANRNNVTVYMGHTQKDITHVRACDPGACSDLKSIELGRKIYK